MSSYAPDEKWEKASKDTKLAPNEVVWEPTSGTGTHALKCSGNLLRSVTKTESGKHEHYWCEECEYTFDISL